MSKAAGLHTTGEGSRSAFASYLTVGWARLRRLPINDPNASIPLAAAASSWMSAARAHSYPPCRCCNGRGRIWFDATQSCVSCGTCGGHGLITD